MTVRIAGLLVAALTACSSPEVAEHAFWQTGVYLVSVQPEDSILLVDREGYEQAFGPLQDSVIGSILVDSVVRDSIFGEYLIPFWRMGVRQGIRVPNFYQVRVVHGAFRGDSFGLILDPRVIDGRLHMAGRVQHRSGRGVWHVDPDYPRGTFTILPARVP